MATAKGKSFRDYCDECGHREFQHGDRAIGGVCAVGVNPMNCYCTGYRNKGKK